MIILKNIIILLLLNILLFLSKNIVQSLIIYLNHRDKTIVGKIYHFKNQLSFEFYNPYLHYDSDVDINEFFMLFSRKQF